MKQDDEIILEPFTNEDDKIQVLFYFYKNTIIFNSFFLFL